MPCAPLLSLLLPIIDYTRHAIDILSPRLLSEVYAMLRACRLHLLMTLPMLLRHAMLFFDAARADACLLMPLFTR